VLCVWYSCDIQHNEIKYVIFDDKVIFYIIKILRVTQESSIRFKRILSRKNVCDSFEMFPEFRIDEWIFDQFVMSICILFYGYILYYIP